MFAKDIVSELAQLLYDDFQQDADGFHNGPIIDNVQLEAFDLGVMIAFYCFDYNSGTFTTVIQESDTTDPADFVDIPEQKVIKSIGGYPHVCASASFLAAIGATVGAISMKRYWRLRTEAVGVAVTGARLIQTLTVKGEYQSIQSYAESLN